MSVIELSQGRKHLRYRLSEEVSIYLTQKIHAKELNRRVKGSLRDISQQGFGISLSERIDSKEPVVVDLFLGNTRITTNATVVYCREVDGNFFCGVELEENAVPIMAFIKAKDIHLQAT